MICTWMFAKCVEKAARVELSLSFNDRIHAKCNTLWTLLNARHQSRWTNSGDRMVVIQRCEERFKSATNVEECHRDSPRHFFFIKTRPFSKLLVIVLTIWIKRLISCKGCYAVPFTGTDYEARHSAKQSYGRNTENVKTFQLTDEDSVEKIRHGNRLALKYNQHQKQYPGT